MGSSCTCSARMVFVRTTPHVDCGHFLDSDWSVSVVGL